MPNYTVIKADVLVIGGGMAGWFAADKARAQGASVALVDKGYIGKAGQSPCAGGFTVFNAEWGDDLEFWLKRVHHVSEYLNNEYWTKTMLVNSYDRYQDLLSWGIKFGEDENGNLRRMPIDSGKIYCCGLQGAARSDVSFKDSYGAKARKHLEDIGVKLYDRIMIAEFLKTDGRMSGAIGISVDTGEQYIFEAGATVSCVGAASYKPLGYPCLATSTGDGEAMAYRAGAAVLGKEFIQPMYTAADMPSVTGRRGLPRETEKQVGMTNSYADKRKWVQGDGAPFHFTGEKLSNYNFSYLDLELEEHAGHGPFYTTDEEGQKREIISGASLGMSMRKADGLWPADEACRSTLPGLFAAGDALGTMQDGAIYLLRGGSLAGCAATGAIAGENAAKEALSLPYAGPDEAEIERGLAEVNAPSINKTGYTPAWVTQLLQNTMSPYFIYSIKKADRLEAALTYVMFMQEHLVPKLIARDAHELRLAHEAKNMVLSAEMRLRSALFRTESRGMHYREDYPRRDDANWLAWTKINRNGNKMELTKVPIPAESMPDPSLTYEEKYPYRFPGEEV